MNTKDLENLKKIDSFPVKGSIVAGYFVKRGDPSGVFLLALVDQSNDVQYKLRWSYNSTTTFKETLGKNNRYQYFIIFGYVSLSHYQRLCKRGFGIKDIPPIYEEPCNLSLSAHQAQSRKIVEIKKKYKNSRSQIPNEIASGLAITFIHYVGLDEPIILEGGFTRVMDNTIYVNSDEDYYVTENKESFLRVPRSLILRIGSVSPGT
ncbi:hypothetical protein ACSV5M_01645 [Cellvibrio sp. ARAG 10.3]|uniref:hypothetical protein n=1 Tax=Cellvibrio sp. ARAG 10.3 TaxID=3451358 RepID=UPI003F44E4DF